MAFDTDTLLIILIAGMAIAIALGLHTEWRVGRFMRGKDGKTLEDAVVRNAADIQKFKEFRKGLEDHLETVEERLEQSVRGIGTVRFNPFKGTGEGGNQSFASAFIDGGGNGVVFSTLHTRERMSIFAKPLKNGKSEYELTEEERNAIRQANEKLRV
ncbi:MAG TPA: DUF4446 family protein [Candidatus Paceibacterota bacterium]